MKRNRSEAEIDEPFEAKRRKQVDLALNKYHQYVNNFFNCMKRRFLSGNPTKKTQPEIESSAISNIDKILAEEIFEQLDHKSLSNAMLVCSKWYNIIKSKPDLHYKMKYFVEFGENDTSDELTENKMSWQERYENRINTDRKRAQQST